LGLAVLGRVCMRRLLVTRVLVRAVRDALAEGVGPVLVRAVGVLERLGTHRVALRATLLLGVGPGGAVCGGATGGGDGENGHDRHGTEDGESSHGAPFRGDRSDYPYNAAERRKLTIWTERRRTVSAWP